MADPVSWLLIDRGWNVVDRDGGDIGKVEFIVGDTNKDIFDGLAVATKLIGRPRYIAAERVGTIVEGRVQTNLSASEVDSLDPYDPPVV